MLDFDDWEGSPGKPWRAPKERVPPPMDHEAGAKPSAYTWAMGKLIPARVQAGETVKEIAASEGMPSYATIYRWTHVISEFGELWRALRTQMAREAVRAQDERPKARVFWRARRTSGSRRSRLLDARGRRSCHLAMGLAGRSAVAGALLGIAMPASAHPELTRRQAVELVDAAFVHVTRGLPNRGVFTLDPMGVENDPRFYSFQAVGNSAPREEVGSAVLGSFAANRRTGEVWDLTSCQRIQFPALTQLRARKLGAAAARRREDRPLDCAWADR
jgi:hypothetical protein